MEGYAATEVARMLGLSLQRVRSFVKAGFLDPQRGPRGELRFSFQDLVMLRTAMGLVDARIPPRRVRAALERLRSRLPEAREAYRRALEIDPHHAGAHVNLGRLLHESQDAQAAAHHYRIALEARPDDATAAFNLGVALEDLGQLEEAAQAYLRALASDPSYADAHYNLAGVRERAGD